MTSTDGFLKISTCLQNYTDHQNHIEKHTCMRLTIVKSWGRNPIEMPLNHWKYDQGYTKLHMN
jgi:hypothetical protein